MVDQASGMEVMAHGLVCALCLIPVWDLRGIYRPTDPRGHGNASFHARVSKPLVRFSKAQSEERVEVCSSITEKGRGPGF